MRLLVARCTVEYAGRLETRLPEALRLVMVKADGCVAIHSDGGAYKPLNWMNSPNVIEDNDGPLDRSQSQGRSNDNHVPRDPS